MWKSSFLWKLIYIGLLKELIIMFLINSSYLAKKDSIEICLIVAH